MSSSWASESGQGDDDNVPIRTYVSDKEHNLLEDLLRELGPLSATNFHELRDEFQALVDASASRSQGSNYSLALRLQAGLAKVNDLLREDVSVGDFFKAIATAVNARDAHRRYLEEMQKGLSRIEDAKTRHLEELVEAETAVKGALRASMTLVLPRKMTAAAHATGTMLRFERAASHLENVQEFGRTEISGASYAPMKTYPLTSLLKERVVEEALGPLRNLNQGEAQVTFCAMEGGIDITIFTTRKRVTTYIKRFRISKEQLSELRRADERETIELPLDEPLLHCVASRLVFLISRLTTNVS